METEPTDQELTNAARVKAAIVAAVRSGVKPLTSQEVVAAIRPTLDELGLTEHAAQYHLKALADNGLLNRNKGVGHSHLYTAGSQRLSTLEAGGKVQPIELVIANVTIVVDQNPATGRPRITIE